jgi:dsDNA-specific endonuclease/ATPase MutS2
MAKDMREDLGDLSTMLEQFKVPGLDTSPFIEGRRKDVQALVDANQAAYAAMHALVQTQSEMLTEAMQRAQEPEVAKQAEAASDAWQRMLSDMQTLVQMAQKSQADAVASLTARAKEHIEEVQTALAPK